MENQSILPDKIIRSRRKTLSLSIDSGGRLIARAPMRMSEERIFSFIEEKKSWILRQKSKAAGAECFLPRDNLDGYRFLLLGEECVVRLCDEKTIRYVTSTREIFLPRENSSAKLTAWLKKNAKRIFSVMAARRAEEMQTAYPSLSVTSAKTRWGSCSYSGAIHFSFRLLYAPVEVVDYVVVHELSHIFYKNHGKEFWAQVARFVPDYKKKRAWLKEKSFLMQIF